MKGEIEIYCNPKRSFFDEKVINVWGVRDAKKPHDLEENSCKCEQMIAIILGFADPVELQ